MDKIKNLKLTSLDDDHIVIDMGLSHTKCGLAKDCVPRFIVPTPLSMIEYLRNHISDLNTSSFFDAF